MTAADPCLNFREAIAELVMTRKPLSADRKLQEHLRNCRPCAELYRDLLQEEEDVQIAFEGLARTLEPVERTLLERFEESPHSPARGIPWISLPFIRGVQHMKRRTRIAVAAAAFIMAFAGIAFWPQTDRHLAAHEWWLGPPAAWGQEIRAAIQNAKCVTWREQTALVEAHGASHVSGTWRKITVAPDRSRVDTYFGQTLQSTRWDTSDAQTDVWYDRKCYLVTPNADGKRHGPAGIESLQFRVALVKEADRTLGTASFDGKDCVGFEISAAKYGNNPAAWRDRIWFDVKTKRPVRIEECGRPVTDHPEETFTRIQDRFEFSVDVPMESLTPTIPAGFACGHRDLFLSDEEKGKQRSDPGLKSVRDDIIAAMDKIPAASWEQYSRDVSAKGTAARPERYRFLASGLNWRMDSYEGEQQVATNWFIVAEGAATPPPGGVNCKIGKLTCTRVDFKNHLFEVTTFPEQGTSPCHPLDYVRFLVGFMDRADRRLAPESIEGHSCFGVEYSAWHYGDNPKTLLHRLWFDTQTRLPVRVETEHGERKVIVVQDHFDWQPAAPADALRPAIPPGYAPEK